jgi:hypothetical protein
VTGALLEVASNHPTCLYNIEPDPPPFLWFLTSSIRFWLSIWRPPRCTQRQKVSPPAKSGLFLKENAKALSRENAPIPRAGEVAANTSKPSSSAEAHEEYQYLNLIRRILAEGEHRPDRTGTGTLSLFAPPHCASHYRSLIQVVLQIQTLGYLSCRFSRQSVCSYVL